MHDALDPEYSILKQRLARRLRYEGADDESVKKLTLSECVGAACMACGVASSLSWRGTLVLALPAVLIGCN